jgi:hypothetical protein
MFHGERSASIELGNSLNGCGAGAGCRRRFAPTQTASEQFLPVFIPVRFSMTVSKNRKGPENRAF